MDKKLIGGFLKSVLNGIGFASATSTAVAWAFPKLANWDATPKARIACGLTGLAWCIWQTYSYQERLEEEFTEKVVMTNWGPLKKVDEG